MFVLENKLWDYAKFRRKIDRFLFGIEINASLTFVGTAPRWVSIPESGFIEHNL
jgi:hypothetical protein